MPARTQKLRALLGPLRVFDAVCRAGGLSRAAEALLVTPGAVSQQIKQLESGLGVPLFKKAGREVELTEVGGPTLAIRWLVPRLSGLYAQHPEIDLEIATIGRPDDIRLEGADCAVWHGVGEWTDVEFDHLFDDELVPVCSPALAARLKSAQDLLHSMLRPEAWELWFASLGLADEPRARGLPLANAALCYQAAADGLGVAMAQRAYLGEELRSGRLVVPVDQVLTTEKGCYLVVDPLKANTTPVRLFREWLRSVR
jgi:LysR family glycine cleavage system transcriptional activator